LNLIRVEHQPIGRQLLLIFNGLICLLIARSGLLVCFCSTPH